jgi:hypothetical protein
VRGASSMQRLERPQIFHELERDNIGGSRLQLLNNPARTGVCSLSERSATVHVDRKEITPRSDHGS